MEHLEQLAALAHDKGLELRLDGLYRGKKLIASATEKDIYEVLGLQFIEPELREGRDEIARAARHKLPKLVSDDDLHGILHCHTTASDGTETLETMANATRERAFDYFGVADHSISAHYAGGLSLDEITEQHREADRLNKRYGKSFRILNAHTTIIGHMTGRQLTRRPGYRKGGVPADRVLNAMSLSEITRFLRRTWRSFARAA